MIIFDLDGTLANIDHRRDHIEPTKRSDVYYHTPSDLKQMEGWYYLDDVSYPKSRVKFKPDWKKFFDECHLDQPNIPIIKVLNCMRSKHIVEIWTGRHEKLREVTMSWLLNCDPHISWPEHIKIKMRPDNDNTPDYQLKERWLDEALSEGKDIEMVFEDRSRVVEMYRRRGICCLQVANGDY